MTNGGGEMDDLEDVMPDLVDVVTDESNQPSINPALTH